MSLSQSAGFIRGRHGLGLHGPNQMLNEHQLGEHMHIEEAADGLVRGLRETLLHLCVVLMFL